MKVLIHICCGTCALYPVPALRVQGCEVTGLWFNPNIHPLTEYRARLESARTMGNALGFDLIERDVYGLVEFVRAVAGREKERCAHCYRIRLEETAREAAAGGFDAFSTTLLISPYQKHGLLREAGERAGSRHGIRFHYEDFRPGFRQAQRESRELGLYRQKYCGCVYSEMERYLGARNGSTRPWEPRREGGSAA